MAIAATAAGTIQFDSALLARQITPDRVDEVVRRIVATVRPLRIVQFGSRARGDHRSDSDLDLAVILDGYSDERAAQQTSSLTAGLSMPVDILTATCERHQYFCTSVNSVHYDIAHEGIVLYERGPAMDPQSALMLRKAKDDRSTLDLPLPDDIFGFHAQQAVEKLLKALIANRHARYPRTHDLEELLSQAASLGLSGIPQTYPYSALQKFAVQFRYDDGTVFDGAQRGKVREAIDQLFHYVDHHLKDTLESL